MTGSMVHVTASMVHVINPVTPGIECSPAVGARHSCTPRSASAATSRSAADLPLPRSRVGAHFSPRYCCASKQGSVDGSQDGPCKSGVTTKTCNQPDARVHVTNPTWGADHEDDARRVVARGVAAAQPRAQVLQLLLRHHDLCLAPVGMCVRGLTRRESVTERWISRREGWALGSLQKNELFCDGLLG
jgi:hypothetical protein